MNRRIASETSLLWDSIALQEGLSVDKVQRMLERAYEEEKKRLGNITFTEWCMVITLDHTIQYLAQQQIEEKNVTNLLKIIDHKVKLREEQMRILNCGIHPTVDHKEYMRQST